MEMLEKTILIVLICMSGPLMLTTLHNVSFLNVMNLEVGYRALKHYSILCMWSQRAHTARHTH